MLCVCWVLNLDRFVGICNKVHCRVNCSTSGIYLSITPWRLFGWQLKCTWDWWLLLLCGCACCWSCCIWCCVMATAACTAASSIVLVTFFGIYDLCVVSIQTRYYTKQVLTDFQTVKTWFDLQIYFKRFNQEKYTGFVMIQYVELH